MLTTTSVILLILGSFFLFVSPVLFLISLVKIYTEVLVIIIPGAIFVFSGIILLIQKEKTKRLLILLEYERKDSVKEQEEK